MWPLQKKWFTFTWQIVNFSMCPQNFLERLQSPVFLVEMLGNSEWQLLISPKGSKRRNILSCYLSCRDTGFHADFIQTYFTILIYSSDTKKRISKVGKRLIFVTDRNWGSSELMPTKDLFGDKEAYLPNDTLTIKCSIWKNDVSDTQKDTSSSSLTSKESVFNAQISEQCNECLVETRIEVQSKNVFWPITNFSSIGSDEKLTIRVPSAIVETPSFYITLHKSIENQSVEIEIHTQKSDSWIQIFVKCKASVFQTGKDIKYVAEDEHLFHSDDDLWKLPSFIQLDKLEEERYFNKTGGVLHLHFEFSFSCLGGMHHLEKVSFRQYGSFVNFCKPIDEFRGLYRDSKMFDAVIRSGYREFKMLKCFLKARSPIFRAMFDRDKKETTVLYISDVDANTMDRMLVFIYSDALEDLQTEDAIKLYSAADKYQIRTLKFRCAWILANRVEIFNVCEVLILADRHSDDFLREYAEKFIRANSMEVFKSKEWSNLIKNNGTFAANVMLKMMTN